MNSTIRKFGTLLLVLAVIATSAGGAAAAIAWDTETTTTPTQSDVDGTTTSIEVTYGSAENSTYFEVDGATTSNLTLELTPSQEGVDYVAYENSTVDTVDASNGHYAINVSHDELADAPRDVDGATYDVRILNDNGTEVLNATDVAFNQAGANKDRSAVMVLTEDTTDSGAAMTPLVADRLELETSDVAWWSPSAYSILGGNGSDTTTTATWSGYTTVDGTNTTTEVVMANSSAADAYASAAEGKEDGDWMRSATLFANGIPHKVYLNEAPEDADGTTVVYDQNADKLVITPSGEEYEEVRTLQLRGAAGQSYGFGELWSNFGIQAALSSLLP